jgi:uncharacterized protein DUF4384
MSITFKPRFAYSRLAWLLASVGLVIPSAVAQDASKLTARQLFFTARPADSAAAPVPATPVVPDVKPPSPVAVKKKPIKKAVTMPPKPVDPAVAEKPAPPVPQEPSVSHAVVVPYLGLRYSILQDKPGSERQEIDPERVFHSGERFFLSLESNDSAYLYVILKASQGTWEVLYPDPDIDHGNNRLTAKSPVLVPSPSNPFVFDENPGTEKMFIVLSRQPERDLNDLIRSVRQEQPAKGPAGGGAVLASNRGSIPEADVDRIRGRMELASRGITVEGVKKAANASTGETAVYLVNTSAEDNSRVIANIVLKHQ